MCTIHHVLGILNSLPTASKSQRLWIPSFFVQNRSFFQKTLIKIFTSKYLPLVEPGVNFCISYKKCFVNECIAARVQWIDGHSAFHPFSIAICLLFLVENANLCIFILDDINSTGKTLQSYSESKTKACKSSFKKLTNKWRSVVKRIWHCTVYAAWSCKYTQVILLPLCELLSSRLFD